MTLRSAIVTIGVLAIVWGIALWISVSAYASLSIMLILGGAALVAAPLLMGRRYRPTDDEQPSDVLGPWEQTNETFIDPDSGRLMAVEYNPRSGRRRYVEKS